jgi:hypothetical protein
LIQNQHAPRWKLSGTITGFQGNLQLQCRRPIQASLVSLLQSKQSMSLAACFGCEQSFVSAAEQFEQEDLLLMLNLIL